MKYSANEYYLLGTYETDSDECYVIGIEARTLADAKEGYAWQTLGQVPKEDYAIAKRTGVTSFKCIATGEEFNALQGCYTDKAWEGFVTAYIKERIYP